MNEIKTFLRNRKGEGNASIIITLAVFIVIVILLFQTVPPLLEQYELGIVFENAIPKTNVTMTDPEIRRIVLLEMRKMKLDDDFDINAVEISRRYNKIYLKLEYYEEIGLVSTPAVYVMDMTVTR